jgi:hypothetical protein
MAVKEFRDLTQTVRYEVIKIEKKQDKLVLKQLKELVQKI